MVDVSEHRDGNFSLEHVQEQDIESQCSSEGALSQISGFALSEGNLEDRKLKELQVLTD